MKLTKNQATQIWHEIFNELYDRSGFDGWWDSLDRETTKEIFIEIKKRLEKLKLTSSPKIFVGDSDHEPDAEWVR